MAGDTDTEERNCRNRIIRMDANTGETPEGLIRNLSSEIVAVAAFLVAAGSYGFLAAEYGNAAVDLASTTPYPAHAGVFFLFGASLGVGMSAWIVSTKEEETQDSEVSD